MLVCSEQGELEEGPWLRSNLISVVVEVENPARERKIVFVLRRLLAFHV